MHIVGVENFKWMCETSVNNKSSIINNKSPPEFDANRNSIFCEYLFDLSNNTYCNYHLLFWK